jgi:CHAT domain-containing protein/tetratricopeptide (TPR) repeat protein
MKLRFFSALLLILPCSYSFNLHSQDIPISKSSSIVEPQYSGLFNQGEKFRLEGEFEKAIDCFKDSISLANKSGAKKVELEAHAKLGILFWNLGQLKESENSYLKALALAKSLGLKDREKECQDALYIINLYNKAKEFRSSGDYENSIKYFQKAINIAKNINSPDHELKCLRQMSLCYWDQNDFQEFRSLNEIALSIARKTRNKREEGICLNNIGLCCWKNDDYSNSLKYYEDALKIAREQKNTQEQTDSLNNIGIIYKEIGNYEKSLSYLTEALSIDQKLNKKEIILIDLNNIGTTYRKKGLISNNKQDFFKALDYFNDCLKIINNTNDIKTEIRVLNNRVLNNIGTVFNDLENYAEALRYYKIGLKQAEELKDNETLSFILNNIGIVYYNSGDYEESAKYCQKAIDLAGQIKSGQVLWEAFLYVANSYKKQAKFDDALKNYEYSIAAIESVRSTLELEELKASYLGTDKRIEAYHNLIDLLTRLHQSEPKKAYDAKAFNYLEKAKARAFLDSLEVAQVSISQGIDTKLSAQEKLLNNDITSLYKKLLVPDLTTEQKNDINKKLKKFEDDYEKLKREIRATSPAYANLRYPEIITLNEAQEKLVDNQTTYFSYSIGKDNSYGFAISKNGLKIFPISPRKQLQAKVSAHIKVITDKENADFHLGRELYTELVRPGLNRQTKRLVFVPDDILYFLPFETLLQSGNQGRWLIQDYAIAYAPSLSSLWEIIKRGQRDGTKHKKDILAFGDPVYGPAEDQDNSQNSSDIFQDFYSSSAFKFFRLKYSGVEVQRIASLFNKNREEIYQREYASEQVLKNLDLEDFKIIHFAAHGLVDDQKPARSSIVLSLDSKSQEDGFVQVREIYNLRMGADLVSLSACQTGLGQFIRGEGIEGLNRAFFYAGASSVLMSLWSINDQASSQLMERFYFHLFSSNSIMDALQKAKLEMIGFKPFSHPFYWAAFVITGDAAKVIFPKR